jgi:hypothetical protein
MIPEDSSEHHTRRRENLKSHNTVSTKQVISNLHQMKENVHHEWSLDKNGESRGPFHDTVLAIAWRIWGQPKELIFDRYIKPTPLTCSEASQSNNL